MEKVLIKDVNYLKGDYATGFSEVRSTLKAGLISKSFKNDVEEDILDLFIRNQDNNVEFDEVIGGDLDTFIKEIVNVYFEETQTKTKVMTSVGNGILVFGAFFAIDSIIYGKPTLASLIMSAIAFLFMVAITIFIYKANKNFNQKNTKYICAAGGLVVGLISGVVYDNVEFFKYAMNNEINMALTIIIIVVTVTIGSFMIYKVDKEK